MRLGFAAVLLLVLDHLEDGVDGLLLGGVDEAAGVDDDDFGVFGVGGEFGSVVMEQAHHDLGVDEVFGAAERDEAYFGFRGRGGLENCGLSSGFGGSHRVLFYQFSPKIAGNSALGEAVAGDDLFVEVGA